MDSAAFVRRLNVNGRFLPLAAVFTDDFHQAIRHWALAVWAGVSVVLAVVWFVRATPKNYETSVSGYQDPHAWKHVPAPTLLVPSEKASDLASKALRAQLILCTGFVILLCAGSIPGESDYAAESILCRGVNRWQYYLGKLASRTVVSVAGFLLMVTPVIALSAVRLENDLDWNGTVLGLKIGALFIAAVALLSVAGGAWFPSPLLASAVMALLVYGAAVVAGALEIPSLSAALLCDQLSEFLREAPVLTPTVAALSALTWTALAVNLASVLWFSCRDV